MKISELRFDRGTSVTTSDQLTDLEIAMLKHIEFIIRNEHRPVSFLDFIHFEVDGREYTMTHGTCRNKISKLRELGIVELVYNSGIAFYALKGVKVGKQTATSMTPNYIGVQVLLQHIHRVPNLKKHLLYKCIKHHPFDKAAVHDLHLKFIAAGLWSKLSSNSNSSTSAVQLEPYSKALLFQKRIINDLEIQIAVHRTDTVTVVIGCSSSPIVVDVYGVIRLSEALAEIEDELNGMIEQLNASDTTSNIDIPNHMSWIVTRWDFGIDGLVTYTGKEFFFSWHTSQNVLLVFYTKQWGENNRIRVEIQEFPNKSLGKALKEKLSPKKGS